MKYEGKAPILQACAIPFRRQGGRFEFCLITSLRKGRWGFPKGIIDPGETHVETALKEADEEAGLRGQILGDSLGEYACSKWYNTLQVTAFLMEVSEAHDKWLEARVRKRRWVSAAEARQLVHNPDQVRLLEEAIARLSAVDGNG
jgi:8-oxo-dGTP pyrophosphatase MutT (NUDIX family)